MSLCSRKQDLISYALLVKLSPLQMMQIAGPIVQELIYNSLTLYPEYDFA